jgi:predicted unusual protein kinase regulating ubiquinone biosynthesis (AarF/ABC1/UbiB family)
VLEAELGPVDEQFETFDTEPISGASLGQVYRATHDGEEVAVKVLRPAIRPRVEADLRVIDALVPLLARFAPPGQAFTMENLAAEFAATIREEMDYGHEARMLETVRANFADDPNVVVPATVPERSTGRVLTMAFVEGTKIDTVDDLDAMGVDREALVERLELVYIQMILEDGVFHADPHPGNLAVKPDGSIVFYDFGITGRIGPDLQEHILDLYVGLATDDTDAVIDSFVAMGALDPAADRDLMREVFDLAIDSFRGGGIDEYRVQEIVSQFQGTLYEFPFRLPPDLALIVRVSTVLEGVVRTLHEDFEFIEMITEYVREREDVGALGREAVLGRLWQEATATAGATATLPTRLDRTLDRVRRDDAVATVHLEDPADRLDRLALGVVYGLAVAGGVTATVILYVAADQTAAGAAGAATVLAGLLYIRTRRRDAGDRSLQAAGQMAQRGVGRRRRER